MSISTQILIYIFVVVYGLLGFFIGLVASHTCSCSTVALLSSHACSCRTITGAQACEVCVKGL